METLWLPGAERLPNGDHVGNMVPGAAPKLLLHKTQSPTGSDHGRSPEAAWDSVIATLSGNRSQPHLVYDPSVRRLGQYLPLNRAGAALANKKGGVETNRGGPIQVEILGYSEDSENDPDEWVDNFAEDVAAPVCRIAGVLPRLYKPFVGKEAGFIARVDAPQRMPLAEWYGWNGICAHQNAPENEHWDVGRYKGDRLILTLKRLLGATDPEEFTMDDEAKVAFAALNKRLDASDEQRRSEYVDVWATIRGGLDLIGGFIGKSPAQIDAAIKRFKKTKA